MSLLVPIGFNIAI